MNNYDLIIVGAGPGGYVTAIRAAKCGLKTAIVERDNWGGVCLNVGCIPTKTLLKSAKVYHYIEDAKKFGIEVDLKSCKIHWDQMQARKNEVVKKLTGGVGYLMKANKIDTLLGNAVALDKNTIEVTDKAGKKSQYQTKNLIIATGSKPATFNNPNGPTGLSEKDLASNKHLLTSTEILSLSEIPKTLTIIGGGVIGIEFACLFNALGTEVTIIEYLDRILATLDADISKAMSDILIKKGIKLLTSHSVADLKVNKLTYYHASDLEAKKSPLTITSDYFLLSTGRIPTTEGFEKTGVTLKLNQAITVNTKLEALDANNKPISGLYAIGDANGERMLAHVASAQGMIAVNNIMREQGFANKLNLPLMPSTINYNNMPNCIYTFPEIASVGLTQAECDKGEYANKYLHINVPLVGGNHVNGKALADNDLDGMVKLIITKDHGQIIGAHIISSTATDTITEITNLIEAEGTIDDLANAVHPHPTIAEAIQEAAQELYMKYYESKK